MNAYIFTGGEVFASSLDELDIAPADGDLIIAADSGYITARRFGIKPSLLLGDLDSLDKSKLALNELDSIEKLIVPAIKDDTDTQLAVDTALQRGARKIFIIGGLGGRLDHTLSTVFLLEHIADKGVDCEITDGRNRTTIIIGRKKLTIPRGRHKYLSLVSVTDTCLGVSIKGVFYPLDSVTLTRGYSYAISNEITSEFAEISILDGKLLVIESDD